MIQHAALALAASLVLAMPALAQPVQSSVEIRLGLGTDAEKRTIAYDCEGQDSLSVDYINAAPNFLAILPVEERTLIFTAVLSGSGVRYASGPWIWWTAGSEANLYDLTLGPDAEPVARCLEFSMTP